MLAEVVTVGSPAGRGLHAGVMSVVHHTPVVVCYGDDHLVRTLPEGRGPLPVLGWS